MRNSVQIMDEKNQLKKRAYEMIDLCKKEIRGFTDEENEEMGNIKTKLEELQAELDALNAQLNPKDEETKDESVEDENKEEEVKPNDTDEEEKNCEEEEKEDLEEEKNNRNSNTMKKNFSLLKTIRSIANNQPVDSLNNAVLVAGANEMRKAGLNYVGQIQLPAESRAAITVDVEGEDVVATDLMDVVKPLQAMNVMVQAGAKYITGLVGDIQYPIMSNASCTWEGETAKAKEGAVTFSNVKLSPKRLTTVVPISKQFLIQDGVGAEAAIREEIVNAINAKLEATILGSESGTATMPGGLFVVKKDEANKDIPLTSVSTFANLCDLEAGLEDANVYGELKYIVSPKAKAALRNMAKSSKSTQLVWENNEIDGTPALCTSHVKDKKIAYGDFSQYIIAQWGNLDITVDNVTLAAEGQIRLVVNAYFDAKPLREEAIKVATIATA